MVRGGVGQLAGPTRTCIGCRRRTATDDLLRVVAEPVDQSASGSAPPVRVVPDPRRRSPGRGAWLHPVPGCMALAERRRAFGRALKLTLPIDLAPVRDYIGVSAGS